MAGKYWETLVTRQGLPLGALLTIIYTTILGYWMKSLLSNTHSDLISNPRMSWGGTYQQPNSSQNMTVQILHFLFAISFEAISHRWVGCKTLQFKSHTYMVMSYLNVMYYYLLYTMYNNTTTQWQGSFSSLLYYNSNSQTVTSRLLPQSCFIVVNLGMK